MNSPVTSALRAVLPPAARNRPSVARYLPRAGVVEAALPDGRRLRMWSRGDDDIATTLFWRGWSGHESDTAALFLERAASARVTLDIGAHVGYFSLLAALANPAGHVYAFEPLAPVRERLLRNVALNRLHNVDCLTLALGREVGTAQFFHVPDGIPSSSGLSGDFIRSIIDERRLVTSDVQVTTVDAFAAEHGLHGLVDLVKIDTEGTEPDVFGGMVRTLEIDRPAVVCEVLKPGTAGAIEEIVAPFGYRFHLLTDAGPLPSDHIRPHPRWRNHFLLPG